jgi:hypothetical protein
MSFTVKTFFNSTITSDFCARLAKNPEGGLQTGNIVANHGRLFESAQTKPERSIFVGLEFSLNGTNDIYNPSFTANRKT